ncbi:jg27375, partial [Pararge aegeria aegeria]
MCLSSAVRPQEVEREAPNNAVLVLVLGALAMLLQ